MDMDQAASEAPQKTSLVSHPNDEAALRCGGVRLEEVTAIPATYDNEQLKHFLWSFGPISLEKVVQKPSRVY